jgi:hypothetical protein
MNTELKRCLGYLDQAAIPYSHSTHAPAFTAVDVADDDRAERVWANLAMPLYDHRLPSSLARAENRSIDRRRDPSPVTRPNRLAVEREGLRSPPSPC